MDRENLKIGNKLPDGSVYAGRSPRTGEDMYLRDGAIVGDSPATLIKSADLFAAAENLRPHGYKLPTMKSVTATIRFHAMRLFGPPSGARPDPQPDRNWRQKAKLIVRPPKPGEPE